MTNKIAAQNYGDLHRLMKGCENFDIEMEEIIFCIPIQANNYLTNAIKNSHELKIIIQEDKFDENSWKILSQGIIQRKYINDKFVLQIQFTKINAANVHYVCKIITKSRIGVLILHDLTFEGDSFDTLCSKLSKSSHIRGIEMSTNNLTKERIEKISKIFERKFKHTKLYETKEIVAHSAAQADELSNGSERFSIQSLEELVLDCSKGLKLTHNLCHAIKTSTSLKKIVIVNSYADFGTWCNEWLIDAVANNQSITQIGAKDTFRWVIDMIAEIVSMNSRITNVEISDKNEIYPENARGIDKLLTSTTSIKNFTLSAPFIHVSVYNAIAKALYIHSLSICTTEWPWKEEDVIAIARSIAHVPILTIKGQMSPLVSKLELGAAKELYLKSTNRLTDNLQELGSRVKEGKNLVSFSLKNCFNPTEMNQFRRIYRYAQHLRTINVMSCTFYSSDLTKFIDGLKKNKTITSVSFALNNDGANQLEGLLLENSTLIHLGIGIDNELSENTKSIVTNTLSLATTLQSLTIKTLGALCVGILRKNNSISRFKHICDGNITQEMISLFWEDISGLLKSNVVLDEVVLKVNGKLLKTADADTMKLLQTNKQAKIKSRMNTDLLIRIMAARPQLYLSLLPLEIWSNIFKQISIPGVNVDFNQMLLDRFKSIK